MDRRPEVFALRDLDGLWAALVSLGVVKALMIDR